MKGFIGLVLVLAGAAIMLAGMWFALREVIALYQTTIADPMGGGASRETDTSSAMLRYVLLGGIGVAPFVVGMVLLKVAFIQRIRRAARDDARHEARREVRRLDR